MRTVIASSFDFKIDGKAERSGQWKVRVDFDGAVELYDRAIALNPSSAQALTLRGWSFASAGEPDEAIKLIEQARRLSPVDPEGFFTMSAMGFAYMTLGLFGEALDWTRRALRERPTFAPALRFHAICLAELGRIDEAQSIFGNAGSAVVVVERRVREWRGALLAKLAEAGARVAILRRVGGSAAHGSWEGLGSLEGVQDQAKFGLRDYRIGRCGGSRKRRFL